MILKKPMQKMNIKEKYKDKIFDNIIKYEKENHNELMKIFHHKPQKVHQLYSNNAVIIHKDDEQYNGFFSQMKKYNKIHDKNISEYKKTKNENKNFVKHYMGYKLYNKKNYNDDSSSIYGNLIPLYQKKNYFFSNKFLSGKKIFQQSGLLIKNKRHLNEYYKEYYKSGENTLFNKGMRDLSYINHLSMFVEDKLEKSKIKEMEEDMRIMEEVGKVQRNYIKNSLEKYKTTKQYKQKKRFEAMKALDEFRKNQIEIEKEKKYIQNINNLINLEKKERQKEKELNTSNNNNQIYNNYESENNNSLFILNRYPNRRYNNQINATKVLPKNKSSINIQSTLYKETRNTSINKYNEARKTSLNIKPIRIKKKHSNKTDIDFSELTIENNFKDTNENKDINEYINIDDKNIDENPLNNHYNIKNSLNNDSSLKLETKKYFTKFTKHEELSTINPIEINKTNNYLLSDFTNISTQKRGRNSHKIPIRNIKSTFDLSKYSDKLNLNGKDKRNSLTMVNQTIKEKTKEDSKWNFYSFLHKLNTNIHTRNNQKFKHFCEYLTTVTIPKYVIKKIDKSFELDDKLIEAHLDYVKALMEQKILKYYNKDLHD